MNCSKFFIPLAAIGITAAIPQSVFAKADDRAAGAEVSLTDASIAFADQGGVRDWRATGPREIYFEDTHGHWFRATLMASSPDMPFVDAIRIDPSPGGALDKWSAIYVKGQRYPFQSFEKAAGPPPRKSKKGRRAPLL